MKNIDFHAHVLPKADHGSNSVSTSIEQLKLAKSIGIDTIVSTPHFYPHEHNIEAFIKRREAAFYSLNEAIISEKIDINLIIGAEVLLCENLEKLDKIECLAIDKTKKLLIELPFSDFRDVYISSIEKLIDMGFSIIIAHAERYNRKNIETLIPLGVKLQLNASAISTFFTKRYIKDWIDCGLVVALGSDIHMIDKKAYRNFSKVMNKSGNLYSKIMQKSEKLLFE